MFSYGASELSAYSGFVPVEPRIHDVEPLATWPPATDEDLLTVIQAVYPPTARRIADQLRAHKVLSLNDLAAASRVSMGSLCHHLRELYRAGVAGPDDELVDEEGRPHWRNLAAELWWNPDLLPEGSDVRKRVEAAESANLRHQYRSLLQFLASEPLGTPWREKASVAEALVLASPEEMAELGAVIDQAVVDWIAARPKPRPDAERRPVRATYWVHPVN